jgi:hypothetical protein
MFINLNKTITNAVTIANKAVSGVDATHKVIINTASGVLGVKAVVDIAKDLICQDYIGLCVDVLSVGTSFIPDLNVTSVVTIPISSSCKAFR